MILRLRVWVHPPLGTIDRIRSHSFSSYGPNKLVLRTWLERITIDEQSSLFDQFVSYEEIKDYKNGREKETFVRIAVEQSVFLFSCSQACSQISC